MKKFILTFLIVFHQFSSGYWMFGYSVPGQSTYVVDSEGSCIKYAGEVYSCSEIEASSMRYLAELEKSHAEQDVEYTSYKEQINVE